MITLTPITDRVQSVRELHFEERGHCAECTWPYPCKTVELLDDRKAPPSALLLAEQCAGRAEASVARGKAIHYPITYGNVRHCNACSSIDGSRRVLWPCPTYRALDLPDDLPDAQPKDTP